MQAIYQFGVGYTLRAQDMRLGSNEYIQNVIAVILHSLVD